MNHYEVIRGNYSSTETGEYQSFGVKIGDIAIHDICLSLPDITEFVKKLNAHQLSPTHLYDAIEDFYGSI